MKTISIIKTLEPIYISADSSAQGNRIDKFLSHFPEVGSRARAASLLEKELVFYWVTEVERRVKPEKKKVPRPSYVLKGTEVIEIHLPEPEPLDLQPLDLDLELIFEDTDLLVVNKPSGLVVHPAVGHSQDTLVNALIHNIDDLDMKFGEQRPGIVHRLDKETSGLLVVAKNDFAHSHLSQQFRERTIQRLYEALVVGRLTSNQGAVESTIARHPTHRKKFASLKEIDVNSSGARSGKWAKTEYRVLERAEGSPVTLVELKLHTGRTHQIRVHLSDLGFPLVGDDIYGYTKKAHLIKSGKLKEEISKVNRFALHAKTLGFTHPRTAEDLHFSVGWPVEMESIFKELNMTHYLGAKNANSEK